MEAERIWHVVTNPAWRPFTHEDGPGYLALLLIAGLLVVLTVWTYTGSAAASPRRIGVLIALRLTALALAVLLALRPSAAVSEIPKLPSTLIIVLDSSQSMSIRDEANFTRWEAVQRILEKCGDVLDRMRDDQQTTIYIYHFGKAFDPDRDKYEDGTKAEGSQTDFGTMLSKLYDRHQGERLFRGLVLVSDGIDNGTSKPALPEVTRWRSIGCPVYCFSVGQNTSNPNLKDIGFTSISPDPSPVAIKSDLKVRAKINAPGFVKARIRVRLKIDGLPDQVSDEFELSKEADNEIEMTTKAPDKPGEVKVSMELVNPPEHAEDRNDKIETYLTVTKEGVRVLVIGKHGWELRGIGIALASDKRFDYVRLIRASEVPPVGNDLAAYDIEGQRYDVIILGDVSPKMLTSVDPKILDKIVKLVTEKGVGFMMTGGAYALGGEQGVPRSEGWKNTPIAEILPVVLPNLPPDPILRKTKFEPTEAGRQGPARYIMTLAADGKKSGEAWSTLNGPVGRLDGFNEMGPEKPIANVLARSDNGRPLLVAMDIGKGGRTLALAVSDTYKWQVPSLDPNSRVSPAQLHARFWKQMVLWLAHQDELEGNAFVRPEYRRLVSSGRQNIRMGLRDKRGDEIADAEMQYQILKEGEVADRTKAKRPERDPKGGGRLSFETREAGEFRVVVWGEGKDPNGEAVSGDATARYVVYPEISDEMLRTAARPEFLLALENTANGTALDVARRADRLPSFLDDMKAHPPTMPTPRPKPYPDWRRDKQPWFLPTVLVFFVAVLGVEWGLRRAWGMV